jgi:ribonuclease HII
MYEETSWSQNRTVCGIDEVGRGCLAGPVVTAAVVLKPHSINESIKDSKVMTHLERLKACEWIIKNGFFSIGMAHHRTIDQYNIYESTQKAMKRALNGLFVTIPSFMVPEAILIDAMPLPLLDTAHSAIPVHSFCKGEDKSISIAAASIIAKVYRDALMDRFNEIIPGYEFERHKGYATKVHRDVLATVGSSILHRISFIGKAIAKKEDVHESQQSLC